MKNAPTELAGAFQVGGCLPRKLAGAVEIPAGDIPVDHVPECFQIGRALVLVLQIVGMLPDIDTDDRGLAIAQRAVLVRGAQHFQLATAVDDEPRPTGTEAGGASRVNLFFQAVETAESRIDRIGQGARRSGRAARRQEFPEERVVDVATGVAKITLSPWRAILPSNCPSISVKLNV